MVITDLANLLQLFLDEPIGAAQALTPYRLLTGLCAQNMKSLRRCTHPARSPAYPPNRYLTPASDYEYNQLVPTLRSLA